MKIDDCRFERATTRAEDEPRPLAGDVVFLGRSNVGKSTLINGLLGVHGLARTSSTPGRTQTVNFYRVNRGHFFIDLPGYGYARAPKEIRKQWGPMVEGFLERRRRAIAAAVVLIDARHEPSDLDALMLRWLVDRGIPSLVVGVKSDKLSGNAKTASSRALAKAFPTEEDAVAPLLVSAVTGDGMKKLWKELDAALAAHRQNVGASHGHP